MNQPCCTSQPKTCCPDTGSDITAIPSPVKAGDLPPSVMGEIRTPVGTVPGIDGELTFSDRLGMWKSRWGIGRMNYTVSPGLYAMGRPGPGSEVLVTANYRMTFDLLRRAVAGLDLWILVLDTKGINVWCAAGKGTFGTDELVGRIESSGLPSIVDHRRVIVPQLGAVGVAAHEVKKRSGFRVAYGPVELRDIPAYLRAGRKATPAMRRKEFPLRERAAIAPMELVPASRWVLLFSLLFAAIGGVAGSGRFAADAARYGTEALVLLSAGVLSGAVAAPVLLPWLPGRAFAVKGAVTGALCSLALFLLAAHSFLWLAAWSLIIVALSSFLAMNFTGSSTYTSLSGVKREMRLAVPLQIVSGAAGLLLWIVSLVVTGGRA